jgi:hypothetical protein
VIPEPPSERRWPIAAAPEPLSAREAPRLVAEQLDRLRAGIARRAVADRQVHAVAFEVHELDAGREAHVDIGVCNRETGEPGDQPQARESWRGGHHHRLLSRGLAKLFGHAVQLLQHRTGRDVQLLPRLGETQRAVQALEQRHVQPLLECGDLPADGRLRERQFVGGPGEAQVPGCGLERFEQVQRGQLVASQGCLFTFQFCMQRIMT